MQRPKAHHFVPVAHLARFSGDTDSVSPRDRQLHVFDKRSGAYRTSRASKVAFENNLYTIRFPDLSGLEPDPLQLLHAVFDPANKDLISERLWAVAERQIKRNAMLERLGAEWAQGAGALAVVFDGLALALELNYLAWKVVRWASPRLVLGDVAVAAWYPGAPLGIGHPWQPLSKLIIPISPRSVVILGEIGPGKCLVEDRGVSNSEVDAMNVISWARAKSEVYALAREDLERVASQLGPLSSTASHSRQLAVRESVLPAFTLDAKGNLHVHDPDPPDPVETRRRFDADFRAVNP